MIFANTIQFESFVNHFTACKQCRPRHNIYCAVGRDQWIDDKAAFIANLETKAERQYWLNDVKHNWPHYYLQIEQKVVEIFNRKLATNDKRGLI